MVEKSESDELRSVLRVQKDRHKVLLGEIVGLCRDSLAVQKRWWREESLGMRR